MKKLETVFSVFLVSVLFVPNFSFGAWTGPTSPFSVGSPNPELPISQSANPEAKPAYISLPQLKLEDVGISFSKPDSLRLNLGRSIRWGTGNDLTVGIDKILNFTGDGIKLPSLNIPSNPFPGTIYYDSTSKEVKLYDGSAWKSIGSGGAGGTALVNPLVIPYGSNAWNISAINRGSSGNGPELAFSAFESDSDMGKVLSIESNSYDDLGDKRVTLSSGTKLCFGGDCKSAWPVAGNQSSTFTTPVTIDLSAKTGFAGREHLFLNSSADNDFSAIITNKPKIGIYSTSKVGWSDLIVGNVEANGSLRLNGNPIYTLSGPEDPHYYIKSSSTYLGGLILAHYGGFHFKTQIDNERFTIAENGNIGVGGVPDDKYKFDVKSGYINLGDAGSEVLMPGGATLDNGFLIRSGGLIVASGDVGIGTGSPQGILDVRGDSNVYFKYGSNTGSVNIGEGGFVDLNVQGNITANYLQTGNPISYTSANQTNFEVDTKDGNTVGKFSASAQPAWWGVYANQRLSCDTSLPNTDCSGRSIPATVIGDSKYDLNVNFIRKSAIVNNINCSVTAPDAYTEDLYFCYNYKILAQKYIAETTGAKKYGGSVNANTGNFGGINITGTIDTPGVLQVKPGTSSNNAEVKLGYSGGKHWGVYADNSTKEFRIWNGIESTGNVLLKLTEDGNLYTPSLGSSRASLTVLFATNATITNLAVTNTNTTNLSFANAQTNGQKVYSVLGGASCGLNGYCSSQWGVFDRTTGKTSSDDGRNFDGSCTQGTAKNTGTVGVGSAVLYVFLCYD